MSNQPVTAIIPLDLGDVANFDQDVFPLAYHDSRDPNVRKGTLMLSATLEEIIKIKEMGVDLANSGDFLFDTRIKFEALKAKRAKLQKKQKTYNPFKLFLHYRAARMFHAASSKLFFQTKETSEQMQRDHRLQSVPSAEIRAVDASEDVPADAEITHIAIKLPGELDDDARQAISDAAHMIASHASESFVERSFISRLDNLNEEDLGLLSLADTDAESVLSLIPESISRADESGETQEPFTFGSPRQSVTIQNIAVYNNCITSTNSTVTGATINQGSGNTGASVSQ